MKIGYARLSKVDGSQNLDLQIDSLAEADVRKENWKIPGLKGLRKSHTFIVWKLHRLGGSLKHLINIVQCLMSKNVGFKVLTGKGANIYTTTTNGKLVFGIFPALAEFERELIRERTIAPLQSARGRKGGKKFQLTKSKVRLAEIAMKNKETKISDLCKELGGITKQTLYRYVSPTGELRQYGKLVLSQN